MGGATPAVSGAFEEGWEVGWREQSRPGKGAVAENWASCVTQGKCSCSCGREVSQLEELDSEPVSWPQFPFQ